MHDEIAKSAAEAKANGLTPLAEPFDTVRGMFQEGRPAFICLTDQKPQMTDSADGPALTPEMIQAAIRLLSALGLLALRTRLGWRRLIRQ
jgi:hypothetical protein